jgi:hypothetical protein
MNKRMLELAGVKGLKEDIDSGTPQVNDFSISISIDSLFISIVEKIKNYLEEHKKPEVDLEVKVYEMGDEDYSIIANGERIGFIGKEGDRISMAFDDIASVTNYFNNMSLKELRNKAIH